MAKTLGEGARPQDGVATSADDQRLNRLLAAVFVAVMVIDAVVTATLAVKHPNWRLFAAGTPVGAFFFAHPPALILAAIGKVLLALAWRRVLLWIARWYAWYVTALLLACMLLAVFLVGVDLVSVLLLYPAAR
jgi:hypothetical protein